MEFNLLEFIPTDFIILIPTLYVIGVFLKQSKIKDYLIPWILLILGIFGSFGLGYSVDINNAIQGVLVTGVAVLGNQLYVQTVKKRGNNNGKRDRCFSL